MPFEYISKRGTILFPSEHNIENGNGKYTVKFYIVSDWAGPTPCYFMVITDGKKEKKYATKQIGCLESFAKKFSELKQGKWVI